MVEIIEIVMRKTEKSGRVSETVLLSLSGLEFAITTSNPNVYTFPNLEIFIKEQTVYRKGELIYLSNQEFLLLQLLAEHPGWVCTKEEIYNKVCGEEPAGDVDNIVYCLIRSLRKKLEADPHHPEYIQTVRSAGYKFVVPGE